MKIGVIAETFPGENRVALVPDAAKKLKNMGFEVLIQKDAGKNSLFFDSDYAAEGVEILPGTDDIYNNSDILLQVRPPYSVESGGNTIPMLVKNKLFISFLSPLNNPKYIQQLADQGINAVSMEFIPRSTKAQRMDALSSQNNLAGYKAVLTAATLYGRIFPMLMTAAATIRSAKVLVIGAGVAGLQALGTAKRLGAIVEVTDVRTAVKEEVQSLGGKFIDILPGANLQDSRGYAREATAEEIAQQKEALSKHVSSSDIIICTAVVPGRKAPLILTREMVQRMKPGSVIVDLAADSGGNCELTKNGETIQFENVTIVGESNFPSLMAPLASELYSKNLLALLEHLKGKAESIVLNPGDEILSEALVAYNGEVVNQRVKNLL